MTALLKVLGEEGRCWNGGAGSWPLPQDGKPGAWKAVRGALIPCERGLHLCTPGQLVQWLGPTIYVAEAFPGTDRVEQPDKIVVRKARLVRRLDAWDERAMRLFAVECAERVLPFFEREHPNDTRPRDALAVARRFADGLASREELAAAWAAAWDAAGAAAWDAAWAAARAAAGAAAGDAAWDAAGDAAGAAAWAAAWDAAGAAAGDAAWAAAWDAAGDAAGAAARAAEQLWQTGRLRALLGIDP